MDTIAGLPNYSQIEIQNIVFSHIQKLKENFHFEDLDFFIQSIQLFGSRISGNPKKKSDLDIKIQYTGTAREDDLFNALNDKNVRLRIEDIKVDFYPENLQITTFPRRGNWSPEVARNLILRYSKEEDHLLDCMIGGGTTAIEAKILNRHITC